MTFVLKYSNLYTMNFVFLEFRNHHNPCCSTFFQTQKIDLLPTSDINYQNVCVCVFTQDRGHTSPGYAMRQLSHVYDDALAQEPTRRSGLQRLRTILQTTQCKRQDTQQRAVRMAVTQTESISINHISSVNVAVIINHVALGYVVLLLFEPLQLAGPMLFTHYSLGPFMSIYNLFIYK